MERAILVILALLLGLIPAAIARNKGPKGGSIGWFIGWWIYGTLLFIVALPDSLLRKKRP